MTQPPRDRPERALAGISILAGLPPDSLSRLEEECGWRRHGPGEAIVEYGDRSEDVFFLVEGEARVVIHSQSGKAVSFRELGPGDIFGEYPALDGGPRSASVTARSGCLVATLPAAAFREMLASEPAATQALLGELVATIRRMSLRVYEFSAHIMAVTSRRVYAEMQGIRARDVYPDEEVKAELVDKTFPESAEDLTLRLSNVTAAFYGLMLQNVGTEFGWKKADAISKAVFRTLGRLKTREAIEVGVDVPVDSRALALVFITAVHSASPEYNFEVLEYLPGETLIRVFGVSRYDRIAKTLGIEEHLTWPELVPFFEGIAEELGIECRIDAELGELGEEGRYDCLYRFTLR